MAGSSPAVQPSCPGGMSPMSPGPNSPETSSSGPPGACITPSREINSRTIIFLTQLLHQMTLNLPSHAL